MAALKNKRATSRGKTAEPPKARAKAKAASKAKPRLAAKAAPAKPKTARAALPTQVRAAAKARPKPAEAARVAKKPPAAAKPEAKQRPKKQQIASAGGITSDAVQRRTGKSWDDWFAILDSAGASELDHKGIVAILAQRHGVGPWWQQMVTVAYEQIRGKREKHETESGFAVSHSRTIAVALARLFRMWSDTDQRARWLSDERFQIKKANSGKVIHARWGRGTSRVDVYFQDRGGEKSAVEVQHSQIENREAAEQMKAYWQKKLEALEKALS